MFKIDIVSKNCSLFLLPVIYLKYRNLIRHLWTAASTFSVRKVALSFCFFLYNSLVEVVGTLLKMFLSLENYIVATQSSVHLALPMC